MKLSGLGIALASLTVASVASAGQYYAPGVYINPSSYYGSGTLWGARSSSDGSQDIGCGIYTEASGSTTYRAGQCWAFDASGHYVSCYTTDANYISAIQMLDGYGEVDFQANSSGQCIYVNIGTDSSVVP